MKRIIITPDEIADGMILAEPIMKRSGQILYALHMQLESKHIQTFKSWGIESFAVFVEEKTEKINPNKETAEVNQNTEKVEQNAEKEVQNTEKVETDIRIEAEKLLKKRMKWVPRNKNEIDLYEMGIDSIAENYF